jgi:ADP-ribosylglycohydrolase
VPIGDRRGLVTDDTQMTLFTVEGMIQAGIRRDRGLGFSLAVVHGGYHHWFDTQEREGPDELASEDGKAPHSWLLAQQWLYARRSPGRTCLEALAANRRGGEPHPQLGVAANNDSKGCGAVMRSAPFGLLPPGQPSRPARVFDMAVEAAGYTHGHATGQLAAGALAALVAGTVDGAGLDEALDAALAILGTKTGHEETTAALAAARQAHARGGSGPEVVESLGQGWTAEEALAIAVYCALTFPEPEQMLDALALAVTHSGDSDSTGAICGNILGALHGDTALPPALAFEVEGRGTILQIADDFVWEFTRHQELHGEIGPFTRWTDRY